MKRILLIIVFCLFCNQCFCWGFYAHQKINYYAVFLLPPQMMVLYKPNITFISEHAVDPDKRRYVSVAEAPRHFIDIDHYGDFPYPALPRKWKDATAKYGEDSLKAYGIVPWYIQTMLQKLTVAFREKNFSGIMKFSAELGHYIADAHVPLHASTNHNGQLTNQKGIHAFWESRVPELLAEKQFGFFVGKATYIPNPLDFIWERVEESAKAADSVLKFEKDLTNEFQPDKKFAFENRNGIMVRQYSTDFTTAFDKKLLGMVERRMRQSVFAVACFWYTAWVNAGQPDLTALSKQQFSAEDLKAFDELNNQWRSGNKIIGKEEE